MAFAGVSRRAGLSALAIVAFICYTCNVSNQVMEAVEVELEPAWEQ